MMRSVSAFTIAALAAVAIGGSTPNAVAAPGMVKAGALSCDVSAGIGLIVGSQKQVKCLFTPSQPGPREVYSGTISKFGLDVGVTTGGEMVWAVYAPTTRRIGALAGRYGGASAEASLGLGAGANVLVGGSDRTVTLQPISIQGQTGINLAVGVSDLELHPAR